MPLTEDIDTATAVILKVLAGWVFAAPDHLTPASVFWRWIALCRMTVCGFSLPGKILSQTTTAFSITLPQGVASDYDIFSAIAATAPVGKIMFDVRERNDEKTTKALLC